MVSIIEFAIFGIMTGLFSAIGSSIARVYIEPRIEDSHNKLIKRDKENGKG